MVLGGKTFKIAFQLDTRENLNDCKLGGYKPQFQHIFLGDKEN